MARYVVVDTKVGKWLTFYPWGEVTTKTEATWLAKEYNEERGVTHYKAMPEMEYYRTYEPKMYENILYFQDKEARRKEREARRRAAKAAGKARLAAKEAAKGWLPGGILNFH